MARNRFVDRVHEILEDLQNLDDPEILNLIRLSLEDLRLELNQTLQEEQANSKIFIRRVFVERLEDRFKETEAQALRNLLHALDAHRSSESFELTIISGNYFFIWTELFCIRDSNEGLRDGMELFLTHAAECLNHLDGFDMKPELQWSSLRLIYLSIIRVSFALYRKPIPNNVLVEFLARMVQLASRYYEEIQTLARNVLTEMEGVMLDPLVRLDAELTVAELTFIFA